MSAYAAISAGGPQAKLAQSASLGTACTAGIPESPAASPCILLVDVAAFGPMIRGVLYLRALRQHSTHGIYMPHACV